MGYIAELRGFVGSRPLIMVGACVVHVDEDGLLLGRRRDSGLWGLPGGALEIGETLEQAADREFTEETGMTASGMRFLTVLSGPDLHHEYPNGDEVHNVVAVFVADEASGLPTPDLDETTELRRFPLHLLPTDLQPVDRPAIGAYLESLDHDRAN